ncbi:hypothetical protein ACXC9Q_06745 [Kribbella sp. CWNU-51]
MLADQVRQRTEEPIPRRLRHREDLELDAHPPVLRVRRPQQCDVPVLALDAEIEPERDAVHLLVDVDLQPLIVDRADPEPVVLRQLEQLAERVVAAVRPGQPEHLELVEPRLDPALHVRQVVRREARRHHRHLLGVDAEMRAQPVPQALPARPPAGLLHPLQEPREQPRELVDLGLVRHRAVPPCHGPIRRLLRNAG